MSDESEFESAFDEEEKLGGDTDTEEEKAKQEEQKEEKEESPSPDVDPAPEPESEEAEAKEAQPNDSENQNHPKKEDAPKEENWEQKFKSFEGRINKREQEWQREKEDLEAKVAELSTPKKEDTEEEKALFDEETFVEEYGEEVLNAVKHFAKTEASGQVAPLQETLKTVVDDKAAESDKVWLNACREAHDDFDDYLPGGSRNDDLIEYIESQPPYIAKSMMDVYETGSAADTIDMLSRMKETTKPETDPNKGNSKRDKQAASAEAVKSRSTPVPRGRADKNDFDGAWDEAG